MKLKFIKTINKDADLVKFPNILEYINIWKNYKKLKLSPHDYNINLYTTGSSEMIN